MKKYSFIAIMLLLTSCAVSEMEETIFIPDATDRNLPAYTEWGYNSFGALYERNYFLAANDIVPCKITVQRGIMTFSLSGRVAASNSSWSKRENMTLNFSFPVSGLIRDYRDLLVLHQQTIDLTYSSCEVKMIKDSRTEDIVLLSGDLTFQRVQLLRINEQENRVILSGMFDLTFLRNGLPEALSRGRFDLGIVNIFIMPN